MKKVVIPAKAGIQGFVLVLVMVVTATLAHALIIESPKEGQVLVVGEEFQWKVRPAPGEVCKSVAGGAPPFNSATGMYEWTDRATPDEVKSGEREQQDIMIMGEAMSRDGNCSDASVKVTVVLPPTTTVQSIGAKISGDNKTFLEIARKPSGELLVTEGTNSTDEISVGATYSDGVDRRIVGNPDLTYESLNEKVAKVFAPGQWEKTEDDRRIPYALVQATGPGKTDIIVRYKGHESRVTVHVKECPYIEGKTEKEGCPF